MALFKSPASDYGKAYLLQIRNTIKCLRIAMIKPSLFTTFPRFITINLSLLLSPNIRPEVGSHQGTLVGITEQQSLQDVLQNLTHITPSSNAYFVTHDGKIVGIDPHTMRLTALNPSPSQNTQLTAAFKVMMVSGKSTPVSLQFNNSSNAPVLAQAAWAAKYQCRTCF